MTKPRLSIVIVNFLTGARSVELARALVSEETEVILVDNSGDVPEDAAAPGTIVVRSEENLGYGGGCNLGAALARGHVLAFINPDVDISLPQVLSLSQELEAHQISLLAPITYGTDGVISACAGMRPTRRALARSLLRPTGMSGAGFRLRPAVGAGLTPVEYVTGAVLLASRKSFERLGGFSDHYPLYFEDVDLCLRARAMQFRVAMSCDHTALHSGQAASEAAGQKDPLVVFRAQFGTTQIVRLAMDHGDFGAPLMARVALVAQVGISVAKLLGLPVVRKSSLLRLLGSAFAGLFGSILPVALTQRIWRRWSLPAATGYVG